MSTNDKDKNKKLGFTIPAKMLYDTARDDNRERRARMLKAGCAYDYKADVWICPDKASFDTFSAEIGCTTAAEPAPVKLPAPVQLPAVVTAPPPEAKLETKPEAKPEAKPESKPELKLVPQPIPQPVVEVKPGRRLLEIPPCFIVTQEVKLQGDIRYIYGEETSTTTTEGDTNVHKTKKVMEMIVRDPEEHEKAQALASQMRAEIRKLGSILQSGVVLVPTEKDAELETAMSFCRQQGIEWNEKARYHFLRVSVLKAAITSDSESAAREIALTLQETTAKLEAALAECDVKKIKSIVDNAKPLTRVLPVKEANALSAALASAVATKKFIAEKLGEKQQQIETVRKEVLSSAMGPIQSARALYLELLAPVEVEARLTAPERFAELDDTKVVETAVIQPVAVNGQRFDM